MALQMGKVEVFLIGSPQLAQVTVAIPTLGWRRVELRLLGARCYWDNAPDIFRGARMTHARLVAAVSLPTRHVARVQ
jgi:hypothetical protein